MKDDIGLWNGGLKGPGASVKEKLRVSDRMREWVGILFMVDTMN